MVGKGDHQSKEARERISAARRGRYTGERKPFLGKHHNQETREKIRQAKLGTHHSDATKEKLRLAHLGTHHSEEAKQKMRGRPPSSTSFKLGHLTWNKGKHHSEETKAKMVERWTPERRKKQSKRSREHCSENLRKAKLNPAWQESHRKAMQKLSQDPEWLRKTTESHRKMTQDPEWQRKHHETMKKVSQDPEWQRNISRGENHYAWRGGISFKPYCPKFNREFRERVRAFFGWRCVVCGKSQEENGRKLNIHHVDYLKEACCDDEIPKFFVALCDTHHAKTNYNREYWRVELRQLIETRYSGKCYLHKVEQLAAGGAN